MKNSSFKYSNGNNSAEAEGTASNILTVGIAVGIAIIAGGVTYVITRDSKSTLEVFNTVNRAITS